MNLKQAVMTRVSRRSYTREPLNEESMVQLLDAIEECNQSGNLHIQMVAEDPGPFAGLHAAFLMGVRNYFILAGRQDDINLDAKLGYYGESLVLLATQMGLGTCWVTETYQQDQVRCDLEEGEVLRAVIAFGHVKEKETLRERMIAGSIKRGIKEIEEMLSAEEMPANWVINGLRCVMCAPSAAHRQPVIFHETHGVVTAMVEESTRDNLLDLGIAKLHFEIGAGNGKWNFGNGGSYEHITPQHNKKENHPSADKEDTDRNDI